VAHLKHRVAHGGYAFAASRTWKIKNREQLEEALKVEDRHFQEALEKYMRWLGSIVIKMPKEYEIALRKITDEYNNFPRKAAQS